jgi:hypothetical protein
MGRYRFPFRYSPSRRQVFKIAAQAISCVNSPVEAAGKVYTTEPLQRLLQFFGLRPAKWTEPERYPMKRKNLKMPRCL